MKFTRKAVYERIVTERNARSNYYADRNYKHPLDFDDLADREKWGRQRGFIEGMDWILEKLFPLSEFNSESK